MSKLLQRPHGMAGHTLSLEGHLCKAAQLAAVQAARALLAQQFDRPHADAQVLIHPLAVEVVLSLIHI